MARRTRQADPAARVVSFRQVRPTFHAPLEAVTVDHNRNTRYAPASPTTNHGRNMEQGRMVYLKVTRTKLETSREAA